MATQTLPRPLIMGILNCTPDSFYDGSRLEAEERVEKGLRLAQEGADIIDLGGESTRPGAAEVPVGEELDRVLPVIEGIRRNCGARISIDTRKATVARQAIHAGAGMVNDVSAGGDPAMPGVVAGAGVRFVAMHMRGSPETMQQGPHYQDVVAEVLDFLHERTAALVAAGIPDSSVIWDPGIGFGKTLDHNLDLLRNLHRFSAAGREVCLGVSRKSMIGMISPASGKDPAGRLAGSLAPLGLAWQKGVVMFRVHDVAPTRQYFEVLQAVIGSNIGP